MASPLASRSSADAAMISVCCSCRTRSSRPPVSAPGGRRLFRTEVAGRYHGRMNARRVRQPFDEVSARARKTPRIVVAGRMRASADSREAEITDLNRRRFLEIGGISAGGGLAFPALARAAVQRDLAVSGPDP